MRIEHIGLATLYLGQWEDIPDLPRPAAIISDPPYGQSLKTNIIGAKRAVPIGMRAAPASGRLQGGRPTLNRLWPDTIRGDDRPFDPTLLLGKADIIALWGAHKFADRLPEGSWLCWDKVPNGKVRDQGDGEAAWLNIRGRPLRIFRHLWDGLCIAGGYETRVERQGAAAARRIHPTQKPVDLMSWTIHQAKVPAGAVILDPYMGSGSTGIAAVLAGHPFVGVECEPMYFDAACERLERAQRQGRLVA